MISLQCSFPSAVGPRHYTEHADTVALTRLRATWRAGIALCDSKVLERTHNVRGLVFYFLAGGHPISRREVEKLQADKGLGASQYLKFHALRRVTETECKACVPFLKFGICRHVFAVQYHVHGAKFVPHGVVRGGATTIPSQDDSDVDSELGAGDAVEWDDVESASDPEEAEEAVQPALTTQRSQPSQTCGRDTQTCGRFSPSQTCGPLILRQVAHTRERDCFEGDCLDRDCLERNCFERNCFGTALRETALRETALGLL